MPRKLSVFGNLLTLGNKMDKEYLYKIQAVRLGMLTDQPTEQEQKIVSDHFLYLQKLKEQGIVKMAGRTLNSDERIFGIVIFNAESDLHAEQIMNNDPAIQLNVMSGELYPFRTAL